MQAAAQPGYGERSFYLLLTQAAIAAEGKKIFPGNMYLFFLLRCRVSLELSVNTACPQTKGKGCTCGRKMPLGLSEGNYLCTAGILSYFDKRSEWLRCTH